MPAKQVAASLALVLVCRCLNLVECNEQQNADQKLKNLLQSWLHQTRQRARNSLENVAKPQREFLNLIRRYHNFFSQYKLLYDAYKQMPAPMDLLKAEFAQIDQELYREFVEAAREDQKDDAEAPQKRNKPGAIETTDYLYEMLERVITRLESLDIKDTAHLESQLDARPHLTGRTSQQINQSAEFKAAIERVKRIGLNTAKGAIQREAHVLMRIVLLKLIASNLLDMSDSHVAASPLNSYVVAAASQSYMTRYLNGIKTRSIMSLLNQVLPSWPAGQQWRQ